MKHLLLLLTTLGLLSMKPAPFQDVDYKDSKTSITVISKVKDKLTVVKQKGKELWRWQDFVGRRGIEVSPDGNYMALIGGYYFGGRIQGAPTGEVVILIQQGKVVKKITLADLFSGPIPDLIAKHNILVAGGGWISYSDLVSAIDIDWKKKVQV